MENDDATVPVPAPTPRADGGASPEGGRISDSRMADILLSGADALAQRSTPPGGWQPPSVEAMQAALPQYEISDFIARGGMGAVYKGVQKALKRSVAIKVLPPEADDGDVQFTERFKREAQAMARLSHPNIVAVHDAGETTGGLLYFVMEFIEGTDVAQLIASEGKIDAPRTVQIISAVCEALAFAHEEGIIHRDIKPSNIMIDRKGRVKVADFGLAKAVNLESTMLTGSNVAMGTPDFIAPEALIPGITVDGRADLYAVGVMLYQMLTGKIPRGRFDAPSRAMPKVDKGFDAIVDKAMQTDRDRRYSTATALRTDVEKVAKKAGYAAASTVRPQTPAQATRRRPLVIAAAAVIFIFVAIWLLMKQPEKTRHATIATQSQPSTVPAWRMLALPDAATLRTLANASLTPAGELVAPSGLKLPGIKGRNIGIRGELKALPGLTDQKPVGISLRDGSAAGLRKFSLGPLGARLSVTLSKEKSLPLASGGYPPGVDLTKAWAPFEFVVIGETSLASVAGSEMRLQGRSPEALGEGGVQLMGAQFRKLEVIQLDPVSEVEALKITGFDKSSPTLPVSASNPSEPAAIKLWDAPEKVPQKAGVTWKDHALRLDNMGVREDIRVRDLVFRASVLAKSTNPNTGPRLYLRSRNPGRPDEVCYALSLSHDLDEIGFNIEQARKRTELKRWPMPRHYGPDEWVRLELRAVGEEFTVSVDGKEVGVVRDSTHSAAGGIQLFGFADNYFRDIEYVPLDKANPPVASSPSLPISKSSLSEPAAIKLWDAPEKLPKQTGITWQDNAVRLDKKALKAEVIPSADMMFRASIRMTAGSVQPSIHGRLQKASPEDRYYRLAVTDEHDYIVLAAVLGNEGADAKNRVELMRWPVPFRKSDDEWLKLELRIVGDELTAAADGKVLGVVHDRSITGPGGVQLYAAAQGYFRDIEYVPLDKPAVSVSASPNPPISKSSPSEPAAIKLWDAPEKLAKDPQAEWKDGAVHLRDDAGLYARPLSRDAIIRASIRMNADAKGPQINLRHLGDDQYRLAINPKDNYVVLGTASSQKVVNLKQWSLPRRYGENEWLRLELRAIGNQLTAVADGVTLGTVTDQSLTQPGSAGIFATNGWFKDIEYVVLDGATPEASSPVWRKLIPPKAIVAQSPGASYSDDGVFHVNGGFTFTEIRHRNMAVRGEIRISAASRVPYIQMRRTFGNSRQFTFDRAALSLQIGQADGTHLNLERPSYPKGLTMLDTWVPFTFAVVGKSSISTVGPGPQTVSDSDLAVEEGNIQLYGDVDFRSLEYLPLDGLSEAEALKLAGVDAAGLALAPSIAPPSGDSPRWRPVVLPLEKAWYDKNGGATRNAAGEIHVKSEFAIPGIQHRDVALRGEIRLSAASSRAYVKLRRTDSFGGRKFAIGESSRSVVVQVANTDGSNQWLNTLELPPAFEMMDTWIPFEFATHGEVLFGRFGPHRLPVSRSPAAMSSGTAGLFGNVDFRNLEYLPLDGLSEAEAFKMLGLDKAGKSTTIPESPSVEAHWKARWSKPGRLRGLGVDANGKGIDISGAAAYTDIVQVKSFAYAAPFYDAKRWIALRSNGDAIWSDGIVEKGCIGLAHGANRIMKDGTVRSRTYFPPTQPVLDYSASEFTDLPDKAKINVWQRMDGTWEVSSPAYDSGTMQRPDLTSGASVSKVDVHAHGVGVLREDGSFHLWGVREIPLPVKAAAGVKDFAVIGNQLALLREDGTGWRLSFNESASKDSPPEAILKTAGGGFTTVVASGFSVIFQSADGSWSPSFTADAAFTTTLNGFQKAGITHFSAAHNAGKSSLLWIEPVE